MKNFKRVISAVIALATAVSSFAAVSASSFTDVADTATYAEAVEVLSALGIVNGYEDGSFQPDGEITRAEAATMIVGALNMTEDAKASAGTSKFADVNTDASWATGYVNVGVAQGFIAGMDDTTFAPKENVTYAQMCVMLTKITGYGDYAAANSTATDWSAGYTAMAASVGINKGVQVAKDTKLTRAQVAMMLYNALLTPQLGVVEYTFNGNTYSQLDGKNGRDFKTLLSDKFEGYQVTAQIIATGKSTSALENNEITVDIEKADYFDGSPVNNGIYTNTNVAVADQKFIIDTTFDADAVLFQSGKAIFVTDEYDDMHLVYFAPTGKTEIKEFNATDYVKSADLGSNGYSSTNNKIRFDSKYYTLVTPTATTPIELYVNGALYETIKSHTVTASDGTTSVEVADMFDKLIGDAQGTVTLIKSEGDAGYSKIFVNYYEVAEVASVSYKANTTTIDFSIKNGVDYSAATPNAITKSTVNKIIINDDSVEDGDVTVSVMMGDQEIGLTDIQEDDIIAIKADLKDLAGGRSVTDPKFVEILVSRDTASGKLTSTNDDDYEVTIDSKTYSAVDYADLTSNATKFAVGEIYKVTLDAFGRIYNCEATETTKNFAIIEKVNTDNDTVTLILGDGSYKAFDLAGTSTATKANALSILYGGTYGTASAAKVAPQNRVVEYTVKSSTGAISSLTNASATNGGANQEYNARTGKIGSYAVSDTTKIINAENYNGSVGDYKTMSVSALSDGEKYEAYVFNKVNTFYSFVVINKAGDVINGASRFAVVRGKPATDTAANGDKCVSLNVLYNGQETKLEMNEDIYVNQGSSTVKALNANLAEGTAFFFDTDSDGLVSEIYTIYDYTSTNNYTSMMGAFKGAANLTGKYDSTTPNKWAFTMNPAVTPDMQLTFGVIVSKDSGSIDLGVVDSNGQINKNISDDKTTLQGIYNFSFADDCVTYTLDLGDVNATKIKDKLYAEASTNTVKASTFRLFEDANDSELINWGTVNGNDINDYANYALLMLVDDEVVAVYQILR